MELFLVRHGHTVVADLGEVAGYSDVALSARGEAQVIALRDSQKLLTVDAFYSSDLVRAVRTAELLGANPIQKDTRLRELNFGDWEGLSWDQVHQQNPDLLHHWSENWIDRSPPGGESFSDLADRTAHWLGEVTASNSDKTVMVTAHAGSIRALICQSLNLPLRHAMSFAIDPARVVKITVAGAEQAGLLHFQNADLSSEFP